MEEVPKPNADMRRWGQPLRVYSGPTLDKLPPRFPTTRVMGIVGDPVKVAYHYASTSRVGLVTPHENFPPTLEEERVYVATPADSQSNLRVVTFASHHPPAWSQVLGALDGVDVVVIAVARRDRNLEAFLREHEGYFALVLLVGPTPKLTHIGFGVVPEWRLAAPPDLPTIPRSPRHSLPRSSVTARLLLRYPTLLEEVEHWSATGAWNTFDTRHDFIQILFPGLHPGMANHEYVLTPEAVTELRSNPEFLRQAERAFTLLMLFYGLRYQQQQLEVIDESRFYRYFVLGGAGGHNYLRITRILNFLRLMNLSNPYAALKGVIEKAKQRFPGMIPGTTQSFWESV